MQGGQRLADDPGFVTGALQIIRHPLGENAKCGLHAGL
jgi:hypothetical protein